MEGGGGVVEAGTSSSSSSSSSWVCRDVISAQINGGMAQEEEDMMSADDEEEEVEGEDEEADDVLLGFVPGPLIPLKEQLEKDKDDESLKRWKEKLLGCVDGDLNDQMEPVVAFHSIGIVSEGCTEIVTPLPMSTNRSNILFTLREGTQYRLKLTFSVQYNIVSGLTYSNRVWKGGLQVDQSRGMLGTFAPQQYPYIHMLDEEMTPSGVFARGIYKAKLKFEDDDKRCHLELDYTFEIKKR